MKRCSVQVRSGTPVQVAAHHGEDGPAIVNYVRGKWRADSYSGIQTENAMRYEHHKDGGASINNRGT